MCVGLGLNVLSFGAPGLWQLQITLASVLITFLSNINSTVRAPAVITAAAVATLPILIINVLVLKIVT
jgi:hypothetical protein